MIKSLKLYGLFGFLLLTIDKIFIILFYTQTRNIRLPLYIRIQGIESLTTRVILGIDILLQKPRFPVLFIGKNAI